MGRCVKPIGGEFWLQSELIKDDCENIFSDIGAFLDGGQSAIRFILDQLEMGTDQVVLVPSYICPSVIRALESLDIRYRLYNVNKALKIDMDHIYELLETVNVKAVLFVNYFGFFHDENTVRALEALKKRKIILIEDAVQMLWISDVGFIGDYVFNSFRKFIPLDGSLVLGADRPLEDVNLNRYELLMNTGRLLKTQYIEHGDMEESVYLDKFREAHEVYSKREETYSMSPYVKTLLGKINFEFIHSVRTRNYMYLHERISEIRGIEVLTQPLSNNQETPLGLPVIVSKRDVLRGKLFESGIYCPIHWDLTHEEWIDAYPQAHWLSARILTLPIDQRYDLCDMDRIVDSIKEIVKELENEDF